MHTQPPAAAARRAGPAILTLAALVALFGGGCGNKKIVDAVVPNQPPEVRLTGAPVSRDSLRPDFYAYTMQWTGYDPDGRVDHFLVAVDPKRIPVTRDSFDFADTSWHATTKNESTFFFSAGTPIVPIYPPVDPRAETPHTIALFAVDDRGDLSVRPAVRSFFSFTQCPATQVVDPLPTPGLSLLLTPTVTFNWTGSDPDGQFSVKPVRWVFKVFGTINGDFPGISDFISLVLQPRYPDTLRKLYAPEFRGWTSVGAETTSHQFQDLIPGSTYLFVLTAFDEAGAYDPVFQVGRNMVKFSVVRALTQAPAITMFNQFFNYTYATGGYGQDVIDRGFQLEVPGDQPITFRWFATPAAGADIRRYRWGMNLTDLTDNTARDVESDWREPRWSAWNRNTESATVGPFTKTDEREHDFFIEAEDNNQLTSLGHIEFSVVHADFSTAKPLLFVDDTRMRPDYRDGTGVKPPTGPWPTAAELDTFLFAKGGFPWKSYPPGTLSPPGIFNGYPFDTAGTRGISLDGSVPLSLLVQYRHVVWYTDEVSANFAGPPDDPGTPITALRSTNRPGRPTILSTYMAQGFKTQGGKVWLAGGGAAYATLTDWNRGATNQFTSPEVDGTQAELIPGRLMYDFAHWREGIEILPGFSASKFGTTTFGSWNPSPIPRPGRHWPPSPPPPTPPAPPNYTLLPDRLQPKSVATDPLPPLRLAGDFRRGILSGCEYISRSTFIREDYDDDPDRLAEYSTLDTLYITDSGQTAPANRPIMTYYHGRENQPFVFSGFNFWYWRRSQCIQLVDWVLQQVWGLTRDAAPRAAAAPASARRAAP